uniref:Uncharacterized protein n=1 Tax=Coccidioides posadasii RMSCC 3488 TaxID=454284 RepID=A0A0J6FI51_COCPO|nr:hypothetical protein CPAG_04841 [Coccidioides posadasii RMSCC 3488]
MALPDPSKGKKKVSTGLIPPFCEPGCVYQGSGGARALYGKEH